MHYNYVQFGLGDNNTFLEYLYGEKLVDELGYNPVSSYEIPLLLEAIRVMKYDKYRWQTSSDEIVGISIDPIDLFVDRLRGKCPPRSHLLLNAGGCKKEQVPIYALPENLLAKASTDDEPQLWTQRNMSSTRKPHASCNAEQHHRNNVEVITFMEICSQFNLRTVDVVQIDTEGDDCQIIEGILDAVDAKKMDCPCVISFETLGHADVKYVEGTEARTIRKLQGYNYTVVDHSQQTTLVHESAISYLRWWIEDNFQSWCGYCRQYRWVEWPLKEDPFPAHWWLWSSRKRKRFLCVECHQFCLEHWPESYEEDQESSQETVFVDDSQSSISNKSPEVTRSNDFKSATICGARKEGKLIAREQVLDEILVIR